MTEAFGGPWYEFWGLWKVKVGLVERLSLYELDTVELVVRVKRCGMSMPFEGIVAVWGW